MSIVGLYGVIFLQVTFSILTTGYVIRRIYRLNKVNSIHNLLELQQLSSNFIVKGKVISLPFDFEEAT